MHHATTALFIAAIVAWLAAGGSTFPGADAPSYVVTTHVMLGFQLLSSATVLLARRLSFAVNFVSGLLMTTAPRANCHNVTRRDLPPQAYSMPSRDDIAGAAQRLVYHSGMIFAIDRRLRLCVGSDGGRAMVLSADAYIAVRAYIRSLGLPAPPPLDTVMSQPGGALQLPGGHVVCRCLAPPTWRRAVVDGMVSAPELFRAHAVAPVASCDVSADTAFIIATRLLDWSYVDRRVAVLVVCLMCAGALVIVLPWAIRASLLPPAAVKGSSTAETAAFVLLTLVDVLTASNLIVQGGVLSTAVFAYVELIVTDLLGMITPKAPPTVDRGSEAALDQRSRPEHSRSRAPQLSPDYHATVRREGDVTPVTAVPGSPRPPARVTFVPMHANSISCPTLINNGGCAPAAPAIRAQLLSSVADAMRGVSDRCCDAGGVNAALSPPAASARRGAREHAHVWWIPCAFASDSSPWPALRHFPPLHLMHA